MQSCCESLRTTKRSGQAFVSLTMAAYIIIVPLVLSQVNDACVFSAFTGFGPACQHVSTVGMILVVTTRDLCQEKSAKKKLLSLKGLAPVPLMSRKSANKKLLSLKGLAPVWLSKVSMLGLSKH